MQITRTVLKLKKPRTRTRTLRLVRRRVTFTPDTVDNEHMGKKKSKCCCIYKTGNDKTKNKYER
ncbi:hypothetical protein VCUG_02843 [Vavraia culicis subsp. floridensis]|uniref:Type 1 phosphatases regulator n=1 Tax=Vavraia culicis (isolate floridensis) TaxID=948595 RepID=A0A024RE55_VAVCU|nr:uncharacterized protein VCUG_02843 [Vavraia culicis subsp. floridensis]ETA55725.1 hypothetical protein VCUG_02843 [Vavraia culicis subsp. floridensis]